MYSATTPKKKTEKLFFSCRVFYFSCVQQLKKTEKSVFLA